eukprot:scaffold46678_cov33-Attheya_sp.AAC.1
METSSSKKIRNVTFGETTNTKEVPVLAATTQTEEEQAQAQKLKDDGHKPLVVPNRIYRPKVVSAYIEEDVIPDGAS